MTAILSFLLWVFGALPPAAPAPMLAPALWMRAEAVPGRIRGDWTARAEGWLDGAGRPLAALGVVVPGVGGQADAGRADVLPADLGQDGVLAASVGRADLRWATLGQPGPVVALPLAVGDARGTPLPRAGGFSTGAGWRAVPAAAPAGRLAVAEAEPPGIALRF